MAVSRQFCTQHELPFVKMLRPPEYPKPNNRNAIISLVPGGKKRKKTKRTVTFIREVRVDID